MSTFFHECMGRLKSLFHKKRMDREMAEELEFHQTLLREKLIREGVPQSQVNATVRRTFGNQARWHERLRELWQFRTIENLFRDVNFSVRLLRKSPGFTTVALLTLILGVGANTAVFSLINGLLLRPLPVPASDQLVVLGMDRGRPQTNYSFPAPFFRALESRHDIFANALAFSGHEKMMVKGKSANEKVAGMMVSGDYFEALQTPPLLGRYLTREDDRPEGSPAGLAVVISEHFWQTRFNRDTSVIGSKLQIANTPFTVVGVMPKRFIGADPTQRPEVFVPLSEEPVIDAPQDLTSAGHHAWWLTVMARRQPGVSLEQVNAVLKTISVPILHDTVPDAGWIADAEKHHFQFVAVPGAKGFTYIRFFFSKPLTALMAMCGGILLLACLNLASLLMARGAARERELATRLAMGATRRRLVQQLLVESMLIAIIGTAIGMIFAPVVSHGLASMLMSGHGREFYLDTSLDLRVLGFAALAACTAAVLIGLVPALQATSGNLNDHIKDGQHATQSRERRRILPRVMLASEVALALLLVVSSGLLASSLFRLYGAAIGFNPKGLVNIDLAMDKQPLDSDPLTRLYRQFAEAISHQPGVTSVSYERMTPLTDSTWDQDLSLPGSTTSHDIHMNAVAPDYFRTMNIPLYEGRDFRWNDNASSGLKIILNQTAARLYFPEHGAIGRHILRDQKRPDFEVIGVVGDAKYEDLRSPAPPTAYFPITQIEDKKPSYSAVVRLNGPTAPLANAARSLAIQMAPEIPAPLLFTMDSVLDESISSERVMAYLSLFFAGCALLVMGIGLYGTLAYSTARRTSEIGIRMALGAQRARVIGLVFRENAGVAIAGSVAGLIAALLTSRVLASFLYETSPHDPWIMICAVASLVTIAAAASLMPAIRASQIEPIKAIRCE